MVTGREAAQPRAAADLAREATLLLEAGKAQNIADAFGYYLDRGMYDDIVDLFAPDGNVEVAGQGVFKGADGVRRFLGRFGAPGLDAGELNDRPQLMPEVSISDDGATALVRVTELGMTGQHGGAGYWSLAIDTFLMTRGGDGKWRIVTLHRRPLMRADYKRGLGAPAARRRCRWARACGRRPGAAGRHRLSGARVQHADARHRAWSFPHRGEPKPLMRRAQCARAGRGLRRGRERCRALTANTSTSSTGTRLAGLFAKNGWRELPFIGIVAGRDKILQGAKIRYGDRGGGRARRSRRSTS